MSIALFYDTETTGMINFKEPSNSPNQTHIVQLAACLVDLDTRKTMSSLDLVIDPGTDIPDEVAKIHGITTDTAKIFGVKPDHALRLFLSMWSRSTIRIAHNEKFDARIIRIGLMRAARDANDSFHQTWKNGESLCTMQMANPYTKADGRIGSKWPKLSEALKILMNEDLIDAHSAMPDVLGCMKLYFHCKALESKSASAINKVGDKKNPSLDVDDTPINFGKHEGMTPNQIADKNPEYLVWTYENFTGKKICSKSLYMSCVDKRDEEREEVAEQNSLPKFRK